MFPNAKCLPKPSYQAQKQRLQLGLGVLATIWPISPSPARSRPPPQGQIVTHIRPTLAATTFVKAQAHPAFRAGLESFSPGSPRTHFAGLIHWFKQPQTGFPGAAPGGRGCVCPCVHVYVCMDVVAIPVLE